MPAHLICLLACPKMPEWRNWYTHQTQNLARFTPHESSSLSSGTNKITACSVKTATEVGGRQALAVAAHRRNLGQPPRATLRRAWEVQCSVWPIQISELRD